MIRAVSARAYANIALVKYWGKRDNVLNAPATPSLSLALEALRTDTRVERIATGPDQVELDGYPADEKTTSRIREYLNLWRDLDLIQGAFSIRSSNNFPTAAGLASSASGYAALATALGALAERKVSRRELSRLARRGSGSAARSIPGGLAALPAGPDPTARKVLSADSIPWGMVVAVVEAPAKEIGSTEGMVRSRLTSPYFNAWVRTARHDYRRMRYALQDLDLEQVGAITESNALAMHACMIATRPSLVYWSEATVELLRLVREWRDKGIQAYVTIDAGPHVVFLCPREQLEKVESLAAGVEGVVNAYASLPAPGARIVEWS